jgi:hypothetical protein
MDSLDDVRTINDCDPLVNLLFANSLDSVFLLLHSASHRNEESSPHVSLDNGRSQ